MRHLPSLGLLCPLLLLWPAAAAGEAGSGSDPLIHFADPAEADRWRVVDDGVMGGKSEGRLAFENDAMAFSGEIVTDGGGFSSVRRPLEPGDLAGATGLTLRVKHDGRGHRLLLRDGTRVPWGGEVMYAAPLPVPAEGDPADWHEVTVDFDDLEASFHGRDASEADAFDPADASEIGLILSDGVDGPFEVSVAWMQAHR